MRERAVFRRASGTRFENPQAEISVFFFVMAVLKSFDITPLNLRRTFLWTALSAEAGNGRFLFETRAGLYSGGRPIG